MENLWKNVVVGLFCIVFLFGISKFIKAEIPKPTINTEQPSYEFTGTGFMLSGYVETDCNCFFNVSIDGENIETNDEGVFQKFIEPHHTSDDGEVEIMATATSNGFRKLESQSTKAVPYKRTPTVFHITDEPQSHDQQELTLIFSGTPHAEIKDKSQNLLTILDENGDGTARIPFNTLYYNSREVISLHAQVDGYKATTVSIDIKNALYDAERIASEKEAAEKKRKEEAYERKKALAQKEKEELVRQQEKQQLTVVKNSKNELYKAAEHLFLSREDADILAGWFERENFSKNEAINAATVSFLLQFIATEEAGLKGNNEGSLREVKRLIIKLKELSPDTNPIRFGDFVVGGQNELNRQIIGDKDMLFFIRYLNASYAEGSMDGFTAIEFLAISTKLLIGMLNGQF